MKKNKILSIISFAITGVVTILLIFLIFRTNKLKHNIELITWEELVDITPSENSFDLIGFQKSISNNLIKQNKSIVGIYAEKNIEILKEWWDKQEKEISSIKSLQWNGIIASNDWYIITNKHVVEDQNAKYYIHIEDQEYKLDKIRYDEGLDLAIINVKLTKEVVPVKFISIEDTISVWDIVFALKKDPEVNETITKMWIINSTKQKFKIENNNIYIWLIQTSTAIEPGFSGWPLININWEVIWINTAIDNIEYWASYSLPLNQEFINQTISSIKESSKIMRPYIWIEYKKHKNGISVDKVIENSPGDLAWIEVWDIIYWINNNPINYNNFLYLLYTYKINKNIVLNIHRGDFKQDIQVNLWINWE